MPKKIHKPEEVVAKLRQVDVLVSQGQKTADAIRSIGVTEMTYDGPPMAWLSRTLRGSRCEEDATA